MTPRLLSSAALATVAIGPAHARPSGSVSPVHTAPITDGFDIALTARSRVEAIDGQFRPGRPDADFLLSTRIGLSAEYRKGPLRLGAEVVDARGYGQKLGSSAGTGEINALELVQAYVGLDLDDRLGLGSTSTLTVGRFALDIGSSRLVGRTDFPNTVHSFTGVNLKWTRAEKDRLIAFWTMPALKSPSDAAGVSDNRVQWDRESTDQQFFGFSFTRAKFTRTMSAEVYAYRLAERDQLAVATRNRRLSTVGLRLLQTPGKGFDFDAEGAYQFGKTRGSTGASDRTDLDVFAYFVHAEVGRKLDLPWAPRLSIHADVASGDRGAAGRYARFDTLFGARRSDFGPPALYGPVGRANLVSPGIRIEAKPSARLDLMIMGRRLWLESASDSFSSTGVRDRTGRSGKDAGTQVEARGRYWLVPKKVRVELGAAYLNKGKFLAIAPNAPPFGDTRYLYFDISRQF